MGANPLAQKTLLFARVTGELLKRAQANEQQQLQKTAAVTAKIPAAVQALLDGERIYWEDKEAVAKACQSHEACLDLLTKLAFHRNTQEVSSLGHTAPGTETTQVKKASRVCGAQVVDWDETEAGRAFRDKLLNR
jgi:hypothetical protein